MADIMGAWLKGHAAAAAEAEHLQQTEENKLRLMVLKHQMDGLKLEDKLRARKLNQEHLASLQGMPEADLPSDGTTVAQQPTQGPTTPPSTLGDVGTVDGLPGVVKGLVRDGLGGTPTELGQMGAQPQSPTHPQILRRPSPVTSPAIDEGEVHLPAMSERPQSREALDIRAQVLARMKQDIELEAERAKPYNLPPDTKHMERGTEVARGLARPDTSGPTRADVAIAAAQGDPVAIKANALLTPPQRPTRPVTGPGSAADAAAKAAADRVLAAEKTAQDRALAEDHRLYNEYQQTYKDKYPRVTPGSQESRDALATGTAVVQPPAPPSFEQWSVMTPLERQRSLVSPTAGRLTDEEFEKRRKPKTSDAGPKEGDVVPIDGYPGTEMTFTNGKWRRTK